jgi:hypothetical protein
MEDILVSRVKVATLGGVATSINDNTRCDIYWAGGSDGTNDDLRIKEY